MVLKNLYRSSQIIFKKPFDIVENRTKSHEKLNVQTVYLDKTYNYSYVCIVSI